MNWGAITVALVLAAILELFAVEVLRSIIDRRRQQESGLGGTQDIAMWGTLLGWLFCIAAILCGVIWLLQR